MGVSKNRYPKWMVKTMENPIEMDDLGVPLFSETSMLLQAGSAIQSEICQSRLRHLAQKTVQTAEPSSEPCKHRTPRLKGHC